MDRASRQSHRCADAVAADGAALHAATERPGHDWIGQDITIGATTFRVEERITRCLATTANPDTGIRDADTLGALEAGWDHRDFGVYLTATSSGDVAIGDKVQK